MALDKVLKIYDEQGNPVDYDILASDVKFTPDGKDLPTKLAELEAEIGEGGYAPPAGGIPKTDLAPAVQTSLGLADTAYQKPATGIPSTDLAAGVIPDTSGLATKQEVNTGLAGKADKSDTYTKAQTDAAIQEEVQDAVSEVTVNAISNLQGTMGIAYADGITVFAFGYQAMSAPPVLTMSETALQVVVTATGTGTIKLYDNGTQVALGTGSASYTFTKGASSSSHTMTATAKDGDKQESSAASLEVTVPALAYIADGLIFQLDGADADNSTWVDRKGTKSFTLTDCTTNADGSVSFNGTSSVASCSDHPVVGDDWTIEVVYDNTLGTGNQFLFSWPDYRATDYGITYAFWNTQSKIINALYYKANGSDRNLACAEVDFTPGIKVHSVTSGSLRNIQNGVSKGWGQVIGFRHEGVPTQMQVGARYFPSEHNGDCFFNGKIYQIRVYNRALTVDEINWNQTIDMNKYNIS